MLGSSPLLYYYRAVSGLGSKSCVSRSDMTNSFPLLPFDSGGNAINPNAGIFKISHQISDRYLFTISADQTGIHFLLNQNT